MNPQELRIGNLLRDKISGTLLGVEDISTQSFSAKVLDRSRFPLPKGWEAERIPLDDEWLDHFGFERGVDFWSKDGVVLDITPNGLELRLPQYFGVTPPIVIDSVHRLQNLYHAYTMKELPTPVLLR